MALFHHLREKNIEGVKDIIPAYTTLTVVYDIVRVQKQTPGSASVFISSEIEKALQHCSWNIATSASLIEIPVCYDTSLGIDLKEISKQKKLSIEDIIRIHASTIYDVYMLGFLPGFAYMGTVDEKIITPRKEKPRLHVAAGSIGIAGAQTGIYPIDSPGGWQLIGKTPLQIFNKEKINPCLLKAGDKVQFVAIDKNEFEKLNEY